VVRKRPINKRETAARDWDAVTCINPRVVVHAPKLKVDGITKYLDNLQFAFDHVSGTGRRDVGQHGGRRRVLRAKPFRCGRGVALAMSARPHLVLFPPLYEGDCVASLAAFGCCVAVLPLPCVASTCVAVLARSMYLQTFDETSTTEQLYHYTVMPLVGYAYERRGRGTCIAYGQTGESPFPVRSTEARPALA
jgi:hypothetical protein